jgi:predicted RNase H-like nuclease (RuvC/YqgF family)
MSQSKETEERIRMLTDNLKQAQDALDSQRHSSEKISFELKEKKFQLERQLEKDSSRSSTLQSDLDKFKHFYEQEKSKVQKLEIDLKVNIFISHSEKILGIQ